LLALLVGAVVGGVRGEIRGFEGVCGFDGVRFDVVVGFFSFSDCVLGAARGTRDASVFGGSEEPLDVSLVVAKDSTTAITGLGCTVDKSKRNDDWGSAGGRDVTSTTDFGGHSRFSLISSLTESPVVFETTLELLGEVWVTSGVRLV